MNHVSIFFGRAAIAPVLKLFAATVLVSLGSCGGGGADGSEPLASKAFEGVRLNTGSGADIVDWFPETCTSGRQKNWVQSYLNEIYLFYRDAPLREIDPNQFPGSAAELFDAYTALPGDPFSFVVPQAQADALFVSGTATSTGLTLVRDPAAFTIRVGYVDPNGPAFSRGVTRGMVLRSVNGEPLPADAATGQPVLSAAQIRALSASENDTVTLGLSATPTALPTDITVPIVNFAETPVLDSRVLAGSSGSVGYLAYNSFGTPAGESQLADAMRTFSDAGVTDLVVDLRYNSGGFIFIASQLAYMVAGQQRSASRAFQKLTHNDKTAAANSVALFTPQITALLGNPRAGESLPELNLTRLFVLTSSRTCSASEGFISGLRGIDVEVILIGGPTCGKPYGSVRRDNCALSYFPLSFETRNAKEQVVPLSGLTPTCTGIDDLDHALGDPDEGMLAQALAFTSTSACTPPTSRLKGRQKLQQLLPVDRFDTKRSLRDVQLWISAPSQVMFPGPPS